jgi:integrase/recombinase XerC
MTQTACHFATSDENERFVQFVNWLAARGRSEATARSYRSDWQDLAAWYRRAFGRPFTAQALDAEVVVSWREAGRARGKSPATLTRRLAFVRTYGRWLAEGSGGGPLEPGPALGARERFESDGTGTGGEKEDRVVRALADAEVHQLLHQVDARGCRRDQALLYVLLDTGMKVGELTTLDVGDVDFSTGRLRVSSPRVRHVELPTRTARKIAWSLAERGLLEIPENGEVVLPATGGWPPTHRVPAVDLARLPQVNPVPQSPMPFGCEGPPARWPLFVGERGRLTANAVQRVLRKHAAFARVDASSHVLRHTFAFGHWARFHDPVGLALALGLESLDSVRVYTQLELPMMESHADSVESNSAAHVAHA